MDLPEISFIRHEKPESPLKTMRELTLFDAKIPPAEWDDWMDADFSDMLKLIRKHGFWGFCDSKRLQVHFWARPNLPTWKLVYLLGHEVGHMSGIPEAERQNPKRKRHPARVDIDEEIRADSYGAAAAVVWLYLKKRKTTWFRSWRGPWKSGKALPLTPMGVWKRKS